MTRLILIRHGETDWNYEGRWQGQADVPLNARGQEQAAVMAESVAKLGVEAIYSSDLRRSSQTAGPLSEQTGLPVQLDERLREIDQGEWEGLLYTDIQERYASRLKQRRRDPWSVAPPGGETSLQVKERVLAAIEDILHKYPHHTVAVISHGFALAVILAHYQGYPIEKVWDLVPENCEARVIEIQVTRQDQVRSGGEK